MSYKIIRQLFFNPRDKVEIRAATSLDDILKMYIEELYLYKKSQSLEPKASGI